MDDPSKPWGILILIAYVAWIAGMAGASAAPKNVFWEWVAIGGALVIGILLGGLMQASGWENNDEEED